MELATIRIPRLLTVGALAAVTAVLVNSAIYAGRTPTTAVTRRAPQRSNEPVYAAR